MRCHLEAEHRLSMFLSFRIDARTAPIRRSRLHIGGARPNQRVQTAARRTRHHQTWLERILLLDERWHCYYIAKEHQRVAWRRGPHRSAADRSLRSSGWGMIGPETSASSMSIFWTMRTAHTLTLPTVASILRWVMLQSLACSRIPSFTPPMCRHARANAEGTISLTYI